MEVKINVAEILKDKPQGTKLYDWLHNIDVELDTISTTDTETVVWCTNETNNNTTCHRGYSEFGTERGYPDGLQILFPSKEMRDWAKFSWKKGDVLISDCGFVCIFKEWASDDYTKFNGCYSNSRDGYEDVSNAGTANFVKLDNNIAYGYVREIERKLGGILNLETLEIEKPQPEFKDGDIVCISGMGYLAYGIVKSIDNSSKKLEYYVLNDMSTLKFEDWLSFEDKHILPITETQQIILFDALEKEGKAWDAEKKQIVDIKKEHQFKPFEKVLVRDSYNDMWRASFFSHIKEDDGRYVTTGLTWKFCIPYIGNESLVGTTKDVEG